MNIKPLIESWLTNPKPSRVQEAKGLANLYKYIDPEFQTEEERFKLYFGNSKVTKNPDGTLDVDGNVDLRDKGFKELPFKFGRVSGNFLCDNNKLTSLAGAPREVDGDFFCSVNQLTTLAGAPREVGGSFSCYINQLTSLAGAPVKVDGGFFYHSNKLTDVEVKRYLKSIEKG